MDTSLDTIQVPSGCTLTSRSVTPDGRDGLQTYLIEAFPSTASDPTSLPLILLLHGFPELAYSWRKVIAPLAMARGGYHVVAPDLRGYGATVMPSSDPIPRQIQYDDPIAPFHPLNIVQDICSLVKALGHDSISMLVGHDFGSIIASYCVIAHPELVHSVVFMSAPCAGIERPYQADDATGKDTSFPALAQAIRMALAMLTPPRKHYTHYFATRDANKDLLGESAHSLHSFLGGYYHIKSGAWHGNTTHPLASASSPSPTIDAIARDLATLPEYYVMPAHEHMRQVVARHAGQDPLFTWPMEEGGAGWVYVSEFVRTGFQGALNYYRSMLSPPPAARVDELMVLAGRTVHMPAVFISGERDWGIYQNPGALDKMKAYFGMRDDDIVLIKGVGHWVQQEAPDQVIAALLKFIDKVEGKAA